MALSAQGYFNCLKSYLNMDYYAIQPRTNNELTLEEEIFTPTGEEIIKIKLNFKGEAFAIKLDKEFEKGQHHPLFHFLENTGKPWSKRCDFVIFHLNSKINIYCIEFKYKTLPIEGVMNQLEASAAWCNCLHSTIRNYTNKKRRLNLTKYVLSYHPDPEAYLDHEGKYLLRDHSIRHYHYDDINGIKLEELDNTSVELIG